MIAYVTVGANDLKAAGRFYDRALEPLGLVRIFADTHEIGYGPAERTPGERHSRFYVVTPYDGGRASFGNGTNVAFEAPSREAVDRFHRACLAEGGRDEGAPGLRPHYHENFYGAYARDLDGNKLVAVFEKPV
ncbi:MAG: VOC family protein [Hyphomicrobiaceae bacterium]